MIVLVVGNGISRLAFDDLIRHWPGEVWACNRAYIDYGEKITLLAGHTDVMHDAKVYRKENNLRYRIIGGHLGECPAADYSFSCPERYQENTGTALAAEALSMDHHIVAVGFDLGGKDVYSPDHEKKRKTCWVTRWRNMLTEYGPQKIHFIGHDHKPFLMSKETPEAYYYKYKSGKAHIPGDLYRELYENWKDGNAFFDGSKKLILENIGQRDWTIYGIVLKSKESAELPEGIALQYAERYKRDFIIKE